MIIKRINPETLSLMDLRRNSHCLYCITERNPNESNYNSHFVMRKVTDKSLDFLNEDHMILMIVSGDENEDELDLSMPEKDETKEPDKAEPSRKREERTYALNSSDPTESIFVEFKPTRGEIRVNFKEKECAEVYFNYFREQFYTRTTGASVITVSNIYQDLGIVNWNKEDCDDWGWYTIDSGTCRHISEVRKTKNSKMFGFTLSHPTKLYETKKREEA